MACRPGDYHGAHEYDWEWTNWNGDVAYTAQEYYEPEGGDGGVSPDGLSSLVELVAHANDDQKPLKAVGSGWAFEDIAKSDAWLVSLKRLRRRLDYVIGGTGAALTDDWRQLQFDPTGSRRLVHVEAGIEIGELNEMLAADGLAMRTLGGSNGQSLAGALATSTHGGDRYEPPLPDVVRAIHLVIEGGQELWIERASEPITQDDRLLPVLPCNDALPVRNDATFEAALVSCGRFGIIYALVLEVRPAFRVVEVTTTSPRKRVLQSLRDGMNDAEPYGRLLALLREAAPPASLVESSGVIATADPTFFQLIFNSQNPDDCWAQRRWETTETEDLLPPGDWVPTGPQIFRMAELVLITAAGIAVAIPIVGPLYAAAIMVVAAKMSIHAQSGPLRRGDALALALNAMWDLPFVGHAVPDLARFVLASRFDPLIKTGRRGPNHLVATGTREENHTIDYRVDAIELVFDATTAAYVDFLETVLAAAPTFKQAGYVSLRPSRSSRATLSMHNVGSPHAVSIEFTTLKRLPDNRKWMEYLEREAVHRGGRPHWGQINDLNELQVMSLYGGNLMAWREALLRVSGGSTTFSNHFTRQRGLEPLNLVRQVTAVSRTTHGVTTHLHGPEGSEWSPIGVADAIRQINAGIASYFTRVDDKVAFLEIVGDYLRTRADAATANNLDNLPEVKNER